MNDIEHDLFVCACGDIEHQFIITQITNPCKKEDELYLHINLNNSLTWYLRLWYAIQYLLGKQSNYGAFGEVILNKSTIVKLINILQQFLDNNDS